VDDDPAAGYRYRDWAPLVGQSVAAELPGGERIELELAEANEFDGPGEQFSLVFRAQAGPPFLEQRSYPVGHPELGEVLLFLVPIDPRGDVGQVLEALINRPEG